MLSESSGSLPCPLCVVSFGCRATHLAVWNLSLVGLGSVTWPWPRDLSHLTRISNMFPAGQPMRVLMTAADPGDWKWACLLRWTPLSSHLVSSSYQTETQSWGQSQWREAAQWGEMARRQAPGDGWAGAVTWPRSRQCTWKWSLFEALNTAFICKPQF